MDNFQTKASARRQEGRRAGGCLAGVEREESLLKRVFHFFN
jgi:hypothetical protein